MVGQQHGISHVDSSTLGEDPGGRVHLVALTILVGARPVHMESDRKTVYI